MMVEAIRLRIKPFDYAIDLISLCKPQIAFASALSAVCGYLLTARSTGVIPAALAAGVWFMAAGAGALNHYQERIIDTRMERTAGRPLPSGRIRPATALWLSAVLILSGALLLVGTGTLLVVLLGLAAVVCYNGLYTPLKTSWVLAILPGTLVGAIPPAMGWVAGGGALLDWRLGVFCFFILMWQIPHVLLHLLVWRKDYEQAGCFSLLTLFSEGQIKRLTFLWLVAVAVSTQVMILFGLLRGVGTTVLLLAASLGLIVRGVIFIMKSGNDVSALFRQTHYYLLLILLLITIDGWHYHMG